MVNGFFLTLWSHVFQRLDAALIRPGRVDVKEFIGYCSHEQLELMFLRFYRGEGSAAVAASFADSVLKFKKAVSPAQIQGYFMLYKENEQEVLKNVEKIWTLS